MRFFCLIFLLAHLVALPSLASYIPANSSSTSIEVDKPEFEFHVLYKSYESGDKDDDDDKKKKKKRSDDGDGDDDDGRKKRKKKGTHDYDDDDDDGDDDDDDDGGGDDDDDDGSDYGTLYVECPKIEDNQIGNEGIEMEADGITIKLTNWISKQGEHNEYIGFDYKVSNGKGQISVKAGRSVYVQDVEGIGSWMHPQGQKCIRAISNIVFCPIEYTPDPDPVEDLILAADCLDTNSNELVWNVSNPNDFEIEVKWRIYGTQQNGTFLATTGLNSFKSQYVTGSQNKAKIIWENEFGDKQYKSQIHNEEPCDPPSPLKDLRLTAECLDTGSGQLIWKVNNPNDQNVEVRWKAIDTGQEGNYLAESGKSNFRTDYLDNSPNTTKIFWEKLPGEERSKTKAHNNEPCDPQEPPTPLEDLVLSDDCRDNDTDELIWKVQNPNNDPVEVTWEIEGTTQTGTYIASSGESEFKSDYVAQTTNTAIITWERVPGENESDSEEHNAELCDPVPPPPGPTPLDDLILSDNCRDNDTDELIWKVQNPNNDPVEVTWEIEGTTQTGTYIASSGESEFKSDYVAQTTNTAIITWERVPGENESDSEEHNAELCDPVPPPSGPTPLDDLILSDDCRDNDTDELIWKVQNPNSDPVEVTWRIDGTNQTDNYLASAGESEFRTDYIENTTNTAIITWERIPGENEIDVEEHNADYCDPISPPPGTTPLDDLILSDDCRDNDTDELIWKVQNPNSDPVEVTWRIDGTNQTGIYMASDGISEFRSDYLENSTNTAFISWERVPGENEEDTEDHNAEFCDAVPTVTPTPNQPPVILIASEEADSVFFTTLINKSLVLSLDATDADDDLLSMCSIQNIEEGGSLKFDDVTDNRFKFTFNPEHNFFGRDIKIIKICDDGSPVESDEIVVVIDVISSNQAPLILFEGESADTIKVSTNRNVPLDFCIDAEDPDEDEIFLQTLLLNEDNGELSILNKEDLCLLYTPEKNFFGKIYVAAEVCDNGIPSKCDHVIIEVDVIPFNTPPIALSDTLKTKTGEKITANILSNDSEQDQDGFSIDIEATTQPEYGTLEIFPDGQIIYVSNKDFAGVDTFRYKVCDDFANSLCSIGNVLILVETDNNAPVVVNDSLKVQENSFISANILENDFDPDNDAIFVDLEKTGSPLNGEINLFQDGSFTYEPFQDFEGIDEFNYTVCDLNDVSLCTEGLVYISIEPEPEDLIVYEAVSPNGDGYNDFWEIQAIEQYPNNQIRLFDKWNNLVWETASYTNNDNNWKGQANKGLSKRDLKDGTYFYVIDLGDGSELLSGMVVLRR